MIKLDIKPYCHDCERFEPVSDKSRNIHLSPDYRVYCVYEDTCHNIERSIREEIQKEKENENQE